MTALTGADLATVAPVLAALTTDHAGHGTPNVRGDTIFCACGRAIFVLEPIGKVVA